MRGVGGDLNKKKTMKFEIDFKQFGYKCLSTYTIHTHIYLFVFIIFIIMMAMMFGYLHIMPSSTIWNQNNQYCQLLCFDEKKTKNSFIVIVVIIDFLF